MIPHKMLKTNQKKVKVQKSNGSCIRLLVGPVGHRPTKTKLMAHSGKFEKDRFCQSKHRKIAANCLGRLM